MRTCGSIIVSSLLYRCANSCWTAANPRRSLFGACTFVGNMVLRTTAPPIGRSSADMAAHKHPEPVMHDPVILVIGSCGLDRLLTVERYPEQDAKIRTSRYHEVGGGNAANTASAIALLSGCSFLCQRPLVKLCSKVGDDSVGRQVMDELLEAGVDLSGPLFFVEKGTSTGFTTVIVSEEQATRTCIHTPGTCGELTRQDLHNVDMEGVFKSVIHFHTDARHTDVALLLAKEARVRGIPVSLDVEKDRGTKALDELLEVATIVFTNAGQVETYLSRLTREMEDRYGTKPLTGPTITTSAIGYDVSDASLFAFSIRPSAYFTRWYQQKGKEVVITKGVLGAMYVLSESVLVEQAGPGDATPSNEIHITAIDPPDKLLRVDHKFQEESTKGSRTVSTEYAIRTVGTLSSASIVDTTGAGDAFIGGYILAKCASTLEDAESDYLRFGSWVAGKKLGGPGSRTSLPTSSDVDNTLGTDARQVHSSLATLVTLFRHNRV